MTRLADRHEPIERVANPAPLPAGEASGDSLAAEATRLLYERHRQRIFAFCLNRLGNRHEADDAVQTTFLYVFRSLQRGVVPQNEAPWLYTIASNACRARRRALWRRRRLEASVDPDTLHDVLGPADLERDELTGLGAALASLPTNQRRALVLREWQGLSYREIGQALSLSQSAVETLLFRARRTLARKLRQTVEHVALALNGIPLLRLIRRLGQTSAGTKTAATLVALSVAASTGGRALEHELRHPPARAPGTDEVSRARDAAERSSHPAARARGLQSASTHTAAVTSAAPRAAGPAGDEAGPGGSTVAGATEQAVPTLPALPTLATEGQSPTPREPSPQSSAPAIPVPRLPQLPPVPVVSIELPTPPEAGPPPPLPSTLANPGDLVPAPPTPQAQELPQVSAPPAPLQVHPIEGTPSLP
ncbi:MAG TPA: sigma-70 family RNA polymerase sigma factor [Gaiellaceae bacterium]